MNVEDHDDPADYVWESSEVVDVTLNGEAITVNPAGSATVTGNKVTITTAATYRITGSLTEGQVIVDTEDEDTVRLILNGVDITCTTSSPVYVEKSKKVIIILQENTQNSVTDGTSYILEPDTDEPNAAIFSKANLTIFGTGSLNVNANYNDGIASKDGFIVKSGIVTVTSVDDGIRGKDYLVIKDGTITLNVGGDGLKSDNDADAEKGYVSVENGVIHITSEGDAISAETDVIITGGEITLTSGGGYTNIDNITRSAKGIKGLVNVIVDGGTISADCADDAFHSNMNITINSGAIVVLTGDDGFHADTHLTFNGGIINIMQSYEGVESSVITINNGHIHIEASDDGINVVDADLEGPADPFDPPAEGVWLHVYGGYTVVSSGGDGLDSNGNMDMTGGTMIVNGPPEFETAIDRGFGNFTMVGGTLVAAGSSMMAQGPSNTSTQYSVIINLNRSQTPRLINLQTTSGEVLFTFMPTKAFQTIVYSSPQLAPASYSLYLGGSSTGTPTDGLYEGGIYTPGTKYITFTISEIVTTIGRSIFPGGGFFGGGGGGP